MNNAETAFKQLALTLCDARSEYRIACDARARELPDRPSVERARTAYQGALARMAQAVAAAKVELAATGAAKVGKDGAA